MANPPAVEEAILDTLKDGHPRSVVILAQQLTRTEGVIYSALVRLRKKGRVERIEKPGERIRYTLRS